MAIRAPIKDFELANPLYIAASVSFFTVDGDGERTTTLATLYSAQTGSATLPNPQTLDSEGKFQQLTYIEAPVIAVPTSIHIDDHETGIITVPGRVRDWATATIIYSSEFIINQATGNVYIATTTHTSAALIGTDVTAGRLDLIADVAAIAASLAAAQTAEIAAELAQTNAEASALAAAVSAAAAAASAGAGPYTDVVILTSADSPVTLTTADSRTYYVCNTAGGNITINLPAIGSSEGMTFGFERFGASNTISLVRNGSDTINEAASNYSLDENTEVIQFLANDASPDNWIANIQSQTLAGNGLTKSGSTMALDVAYANNWTAPQRSAALTDNDGSFDLSAKNNFTCTPTGTIANFTVTNYATQAGQTGIITLVNPSGHDITAFGAMMYGGASAAAAIRQPGTIKIGYECDGSTVTLFPSEPTAALV